MGPRVSVDYADVAVDLVPPVSELSSPVTLMCGPHTSGLTWTRPVDLMTSGCGHADAIFIFWNLIYFIIIRKFQKLYKLQ